MPVGDETLCDGLLRDRVKQGAGRKTRGKRPTNGGSQAGVSRIRPIEVPAGLEVDEKAHFHDAADAGVKAEEIDLPERRERIGLSHPGIIGPRHAPFRERWNRPKESRQGRCP